MKHTHKIYFFIVLTVLALALSACGGPTVAEVEATAAAAAAAEIDPVAIKTSAVETVAAQITETALSFSPTPLPATATPTMIVPTATLVNLNSTPIPTVSIGTPPTLVVGGPTLLPTATQVVLGTTPEGPICDEMTYGSPVDVNYPDGSTVKAGTDFEKIWRVYNTGVCTWDDGYRLIPVASSSTRSGDNNPLDAVNPAWEISKHGSSDKFVEPGGVVDIDVNLTAPLDNGEYSTCFILENDRGVYFGGVLCVEIVVKGN